jgi:GntR family colanic acid and biofilm gene transcriptional regulator
VSIVLNQPQRQSLVSNIEDQLREAMLSGRLQPGQRLKTRELARQLGTSLTPVRESLIRLVAAGALTAAPAQAFQVPILTKREYLEICKIRQAVEGLAAEEAAKVISDAEIDELEILAQDFLEAKREGDAVRALECNKRFRFALYSCAGMPNLMTIIESLWLRIGPCFNYLYPQQPIRTESHHNYEDLIAALRRGDSAAVKRAIERAIVDGVELLLPYLADDQTRVPTRTDPASLALP